MSISIQGVPPQFEQQELEQRQRQKTHVFLNTMQCLHRVRQTDYKLFFNELAELFSKGYTVSDESPLLSPQRYMILLNKPAEVLALEVEALEAQAKVEYIEELEAAHADYQEQLIQQMLEADKLKEQKALEAKQAKRFNEIKDLASKTYTPLSIPQ